MSIFQIRYIINGFRIGKIPDKSKIWINNKNAFFQRNDNELSCLILTSDEKYEANLHSISKDALMFIKIHSLISNQGCTVKYSGTSKLKTKSEIGKKLAVTSSFLIQNLKYISEDSVEETKTLFEQLKNDIQKYKSLEIGLEYWSLAKELQLKSGKYEPIQFLHAMISLESLLGGNTEIRYKISIRLALLLGLIGYSSLEVFENTKVFYDKRSKLLHGGSTINDNSEITSEDVRTIIEYAKDCILCCMIIAKKLYKDNARNFRDFLLSLIDSCILNIEKRRELKQELHRDKLLDFTSI